MSQQPPFSELLDRFCRRDGRHVRQLSQAITNRFGADQCVPHNSISRWRRGVTGKVQSWKNLVKLAAILRLNHTELDDFLGASGHPTRAELIKTADNKKWFVDWETAVTIHKAPFQAPPLNIPFVGREDQFSQIGRFLRSQVTFRVCVLMGLPGVGKTALAIFLAHQLKPMFPGGVIWLQLDEAVPTAALQTIAAAYQIDLSPYPEVSSQIARIRQLLAEKRMLLIADNATSEAQLNAILPPTGTAAVVVTTQRQDLAILDSGYRLTLPPFRADGKDSLALFGAILGKTAVRQQAEPLRQIAHFVGHLPLALAIVGQRLQHEPGWSAEHFLHRLQTESAPLSLLKRGEKSVEAMLAQSVQQLAKDDRPLLTSLALFGTDHFSVRAAAAVAGLVLAAAEDGLRRLHAGSLILVASADRYVLQPLIHLYCKAILSGSKQVKRFVDYFLDYIVTHQADFTLLAAEDTHLLSALDQAEDADFVEAVVLLCPYWHSNSQNDLAAHYLLKAAAVAKKVPGTEAQLTILHNLGYTAMKQGNISEAAEYYQEALSLAHEANDPRQECELLLKLGALAHRRGQFEEALLFYQDGLPLAEAARNSQQRASLLANIGLLSAIQGAHETAVSHYEQALPLARDLPEPFVLISILQNYGDLVESMGNYAQARDLYQEGLKLAETSGDPDLRSQILGNLGLIAAHLGNYSQALATFRSGLALAEKNGLKIQICRQQSNLGYVTMLQDRQKDATYHYKEALIIARSLDFPEELSVILNQMGNNYLKERLFDEAVAVFEEARTIAQEANILREVAFSQYGLAKIAARRGNVAQAHQLGGASRAILVDIKHQKSNEVWWWLRELPGTLDNS
ncbi:hypothetical protein MNBD_CHLOROFLEXI01-5179 [hydrothermal vent metagenome]|uniref:AAA+ ATPase domain-containing protein n=1 Tax=hydrothermal vent metagenome TaxID=652676 RepID=A0A3B0UHZ8_9ZZZZ